MGLFSMYTGFIYNDIFSKSLNLFGSHWHTNYNESTVMSNKDLQINPSLSSDYDQVPYPVGLDPVWQVNIYDMFLKLKQLVCNLFVKY